MKLILKFVTLIGFWYMLIVILVTLVGCKSTKTNSIDTTKDTVMVNRVLTVTPASLNEIVLEDICDSLGNVRPINYISNTTNTKTSVKSNKNTLKIKVNIDSIKQEAIDTYKSTLKDKKEVKIIEKKNPLNYKLLLYSILLTLWTFRKPIIKLIKPI